MTKLTKEIAFRVIFHKYMRHAMWRTVKKTIRVIMNVEKKFKPVKIKEPQATTKRDKPIACKASVQIVRYCS